MIDKLLNLLPKNRIADECHDGKGLLMTRYYLTPKIFGCRLVIHQFHRSDNDRHYHDHPWNFISFILKGSYIEHWPMTMWKDSTAGSYRVTSDIQQCHRRFSIIKRPKTWKHWVELSTDDCCNEPVESWTLVLLYGERRDWGFHTKEGWIRHDLYDCRGQNHGRDTNTST